MDDKTKKPDPKSGAPEPGSQSAFNRIDTPAASPAGDTQAIPSQPRSFSPVRPQRNAVPRKDLAKPEAGTAGDTASVPEPPKASATDKHVPAASGGVGATGSSSLPKAPDPSKPAAAAGTGSTSSFPRAGSSGATATPTSTPVTPASPASPAAATGATSARKTSDTDKMAAASGSGTSSFPKGKAASAAAAGAAAGAAAAVATPPQSSGAGGDTIRLRVQPRPHARTLNTAPGRGLRRRLPDIRSVRAGGGPSTAASYGPFALMFGFLWLIFKMVFFTALVLGLGALIGFMVMTEYIKTPEVIVPNVSGMKVDEAFEVLSDKELGVIKLRVESSGLVAPGEIISQQPPAGARAKVNTDVGVVISSGRSQFVVPDVVGETRDNAVNKIKGARLEVGNILALEDNTVPAGSVISQTPLGGTGSDEAVKVDLMVSAGPPGKSLNMPDLTGLTVLEAKAALKAVGIENVSTVPEDAEADAKVTAQDPLVSKTVFQTDKVTLTTGK